MFEVEILRLKLSMLSISSPDRQVKNPPRKGTRSSQRVGAIDSLNPTHLVSRRKVEPSVEPILLGHLPSPHLRKASTIYSKSLDQWNTKPPRSGQRLGEPPQMLQIFVEHAKVGDSLGGSWFERLST